VKPPVLRARAQHRDFSEKVKRFIFSEKLIKNNKIKKLLTLFEITGIYYILLVISKIYIIKG